MMDKKTVKAIKFAIKKEKESQKIYSKLIKKAINENQKIILEQLFLEETKHELFLKSFLRNESLKKAKQDLQNSFVEEQASEKFKVVSRLSFPTIINKTISEALEFAISHEQKYENMYLKLYKEALTKNQEELSNLYMKFYKEEKRHENIITQEYLKIIK